MFLLANRLNFRSLVWRRIMIVHTLQRLGLQLLGNLLNPSLPKMSATT